MGPFEFIIALVAMVLGSITVWVGMLSKNRQDDSIRPKGKYEVGELAAIAESLQERVDVLESILDVEVPDWREHNMTVDHKESAYKSENHK
ncbi:MAG: envelope stress response membrane protein PspB [Gammaproteobacteria bacterium]|nr:envelope stress response membrane protein PspB [Gammaproteobacteria bacterium]